MNVILAASITTLLFNANPLMRFDGYHILADVLDAPNLWTHGRQFVRSVGRKVFFGLNSGNAPWRPSQTRLVRAYGIAAAIWKVLIYVSLTLAAISILDGPDWFLPCSPACCGSVYRLFKWFASCCWHRNGTARPPAIRAVSSGCVLMIVMFGLIVPAPTVVSAPVVVQHDPLTIFATRLPVSFANFLSRPGQRVAAGDVLCRLENIDLQAELRVLHAQLLASEQRVRTYQSSGEPAAMRIELDSTRDLRERLAELSELIELLVIMAPHDGVIIGSDLEQRIGTFVKPGSEIVTIGGDKSRTAIALVSQDASQSLENLDGHPADVRIWGSASGPLAGQVDKIHPRAQTSLAAFFLRHTRRRRLGSTRDQRVRRPGRTKLGVSSAACEAGDRDRSRSQ